MKFKPIHDEKSLICVSAKGTSGRLIHDAIYTVQFETENEYGIKELHGQAYKKDRFKVIEPVAQAS